MAAFNVGDRCRGVNFTGQFAFRNGMIGTIHEGFRVRSSQTAGTSMVTADWTYVVLWADGSIRTVGPHYIEHLFTKENAEWAKAKLDTMLERMTNPNLPRRQDGK